MANRTFGSSALKDDGVDKVDSSGEINSKTKIINIDDYRKKKGVVEEKITRVSEETSKNLDGNKNLEDELKSEIRLIINEEKIKTSNEEINDLAEIISKNLGIENSSEIQIEAKKIRIEVQKWKDENITEVENFRKEEFEKKFEEETKKLNPDLKNEELDKVKEYGKLISETYSKESIIENQKNEALEVNSRLFSPGRLESSWTDLKGVVNFLQKSPEGLKGIKEKYNSLKEGLSGVNLPNLKEGRSFEKIMAGFNDPNTDQLFARTKKYLGWADRVDKLTGGWLNKTVTDAGMRMVSNIGNQAIQEFATNSLNVMAQQGFQKGFTTVLNGIMSGGVKKGVEFGIKTGAEIAVKTGVKVAVTTGAELGTEAVIGTVGGAATGGILTIAMIALEAVKAIKKVGDKIAEKLGISTKKFFEENFGKVGGKILGGIASIVALPTLLIGTVSAVAVGPILIIIFVGLFGYQMMQGNLVSSLVPPKGTTSSSSTSDENTDNNGSSNVVDGKVGKKVNDLKYSGHVITNTVLTNINISSNIIGMNVYYGKFILRSMTTNIVIADQVVELLQDISEYIAHNSYVTNKSILTAGMYDPPDGSAPYPHEYALGIDLFNNWSYTYNGTTYYPYADYKDSARYRKFICEVCKGDEACPQNINYHIYETIFKPAGWCWGGYWGENSFDPMHYEVLRPWENECFFKNKIKIKCN